MRTNSIRVGLTLALALALPLSLRAEPERRPWPPAKSFSAVRRAIEMEIRLAQSHLRGMLRTSLKRPEPRWTPARFGKGELELGPGGVPILRLRGTPTEMGEQHGRLLRREVQILARVYLPAFLGKDYEKARRSAREFLEHFAPHHRAELAALAKGAEVELDEILLGQTFADQYRAWACSCVSSVGCIEGPIFGRNLDFIDMGFLHKFSIVTVYQPDGGRALVSLGFPGLIGVISGMNEEGLCAAVMVVHDGRGLNVAQPFALLFRRVLEESKDIAQAEGILTKAKITVSNNLMLCSPETARVFELRASGPSAHVRKPDERGLIYSTNHFEEREQDSFGVTWFDSQQRFSTLEKCCAADRERGAIREGLVKTAPAAANVQSMIFAPRARAIEVAFGAKPAARRGYQRLEAELLFKKP